MRLATVATVVLLAGNAWGDLYTDYVSSVEWLVDSADEIYLVEVVERTDRAQQLTVKIRDILKTREPDKDVAASDEWPLHRWRTEGAVKDTVIALSGKEFVRHRNWAY